MKTSRAADRLAVAARTSRRWRRSSARPRRARCRAARRSARASSGFERPEKSISRFCGPRSIQWRRARSSGTTGSTVSSPGSVASAHLRPAFVARSLPCSPGASRATASDSGGTSSVMTEPAPIQASSPISTGATNALWTPVTDVAADRRPALRLARLVREVGRDVARARCSCPRRSPRRRCTTGAAPSCRSPMREFLISTNAPAFAPASEHRSGAKVTERADQSPRADLGVDGDRVRADLGAARRPASRRAGR